MPYCLVHYSYLWRSLIETEGLIVWSVLIKSSDVIDGKIRESNGKSNIVDLKSPYYP
jgi:hypothetical protein